MRRWFLRFLTVALAGIFSACAYAPAYRPPWLVSAPPQRTYSSYRHSRSSERARAARSRSVARESSPATTTDLGADRAAGDSAARGSAAVSSPPPVSLSLAGDSHDRERAQRLLVDADADLHLASKRRLSAAQRETYERASQLAHRARRALADNDCAAASSLAGKASSLAAGISGK